jgi:hypothetical protein
MKHKVKKFGRGGDIITGIGAALLGKALYDKYKGGKDKDDDYTRRVKEYGVKGKFPEEKSEEKAKPKREEYVAADKEENEAKKSALSRGMQYKKPEGPAAQERKITTNKYKSEAAPATAANTSTDSTTSSSSFSDSPAVKTTEHRKFLQSKAGLSGKGITTPGDPNAKGSRQKGRSANPIQETIDSAGKSMARTPQQKMAEGAREVERRRQAEKKKKDDEANMKGALKKGGAVKKYASGGSVSSASKRADGIAIRGKTRA